MPKGGGCGSPCHASPVPISTTSCAPPRRREPQGMTAGQVKAVVAEAEEFKPEPPRPLMRELPPADRFPVEALGEILAAAARAIHDKVQAPMAICAQSVLAAATLAVQAHADVELPTRQVRPSSCFFVTVAASGERKTACDTEALWPIRKHEARLRAEHELEAAHHQNELDSWHAERKRILNKKTSAESKREALEELLGPPPSAPLTPMLTCPGPTYEGLCKLLAVGQPSVRRRGRAVHRRPRSERRKQAAHGRRPVLGVGRRADPPGARRRRQHHFTGAPGCDASDGSARRRRDPVVGSPAVEPGIFVAHPRNRTRIGGGQPAMARSGPLERCGAEALRR